MHRYLALVVILVLLAGCGGGPAAVSPPSGTPRRALGPNDTEYTIRHDTVLRTYVLHAPPGAASRQDNPVVVVLWDNGSADTAIVQSGWSQKADAEGFIVAYGQADRALWNDGSPAGLAGRVRNGDVGYVSAVLTDVGRHFGTDARRLYVAGFGNGGSVAWLAAGEMTHRLAAVAMVGGHLYPDQLSASQSRFGVSLLYVVGTADPQYPLNGGSVLAAGGSREERPALQRSIDRWNTVMGCAAGTSTGDLAAIRTTTYPRCREGTDTVLETLGGHGHTWPGGLVAGGQRAADRIDATARFWEFFKTRPKTLPS